MYTYDEVVSYVTAANIAGYMENEGVIYVPDDDDLTQFIGKQLEIYNSAVECASLGGKEYPIWHDWISDALLKEYKT